MYGALLMKKIKLKKGKKAETKKVKTIIKKRKSYYEPSPYLRAGLKIGSLLRTVNNPKPNLRSTKQKKEK